MDYKYSTYMKRCLELGVRGLGQTSPNPMVGSVIVCKDKIIGEGFHKKYGTAHAEVNAINSVKDKAQLKNSVLFVNLEPCSHQGKTPPCSDYIIQHKIPKVVIGTIDSNSLVAGKGIEKLRKNGIEVVENILHDECLSLNKRFFTFHGLKRPYIILKWAQTQDGYIDIYRSANSKQQPTWISNSFSKKLVHKWRSEERSILVGTGTAQADDPSLTTREWPGKSPLRMVLDRNLKLNNTLKLFNQQENTVVFNSIKSYSDRNITYQKISFDEELPHQINKFLFDREIDSLIVEGGRQLLQTYIDAGLWDEARVFIGAKKFNNGVDAPIFKKPVYQSHQLASDMLLIFRNI